MLKMKVIPIIMALLFALPIASLGQDYKVREIVPYSEQSNLQEKELYDTFLRIYNIKSDIHYYDNQRIILVPTITDRIFEYYGVSGFTSNDGEVYKGEMCPGSYERQLVTDSFTVSNNVTTPADSIECKVLVINDAFFSHKEVKRQFDGWSDTISASYLTLNLTDENGESLRYTCDITYNGVDQTPFLILSTIDRLKQRFVGHSFDLKEGMSARIARTTTGTISEISFPITVSEIAYLKGTKRSSTIASESLTFWDAIPYLFFEDKSGVVFFIPFGNSGPEYDVRSSQERLSDFVKHRGYISIYDLVPHKKQNPSEQALAQSANPKNQSAKPAKRKNISQQEEEYNRVILLVQRYSYLINKYGKELGDIIASGKVRIGMTKEQCTDALGKPSKIERVVYQGGTMEHWFYSDDRYLRFDNNSLVSVQESVKP